MGKTGISKETWEGTNSVVDFPLCPIGLGMEFEIVGVREGTADDRKTGETYEYVAFDCRHYDDNADEHRKGEFFRLDDNGLGLLKGFLEKIGRCDLMDDDVEWEEIESTRFTTDVKHSKPGKDGTIYANFVRSSIEALTHDYFTMADVPTRDQSGDENEPDIQAEESSDDTDIVPETAPAKQAKKAIAAAKSLTPPSETSGGASPTKATPRRGRRAATPR